MSTCYKNRLKWTYEKQFFRIFICFQLKAFCWKVLFSNVFSYKKKWEGCLQISTWFDNYLSLKTIMHCNSCKMLSHLRWWILFLNYKCEIPSAKKNWHVILLFFSSIHQYIGKDLKTLLLWAGVEEKKNNDEWEYISIWYKKTFSFARNQMVRQNGIILFCFFNVWLKKAVIKFSRKKLWVI